MTTVSTARPATVPAGPAATRDAILDAAEREFGRAGYRHTTIGGVADAAGVSRPLVYRYFGDKETLYRLVVERLLQRWNHALVEAASTPAPSSADRLRSVMTACLEWSASRAMLRGVLLRDGDLTHRVARATLEQGRARLPALLTEVLTDGAARGDLRADLDPAAMASVIEEVLVAGSVATMSGRADPDPADRAATIIELVLHGVVP